MPKVDGEDLEAAKAVKDENLTGPSEQELSAERESTVAYVPPGEDAPKAKATAKKAES